MLPIDVYNNGDTAIFGIYLKEALRSPLMYTAMAVLRFSYIWQGSFVFAVAAWINGETAIFGIYYKEVLCSLSLHASIAKPQFSAYVIKKLCARHRCLQQWHRDFGI